MVDPNMTKIFEKWQEQEFFNWLVEAPEAGLMWRRCHAIIGLTDMLRMDITCIVHKEGTVPQVFNFGPDPKKANEVAEVMEEETLFIEREQL